MAHVMTKEKLKKKPKIEEIPISELFLSAEYKKWLENKEKVVVKQFNVPFSNISLIYDTESNIAAFTDYASIHVNAGSEAFYSEEQNEHFDNVSGAIFHEIGHKLFTNTFAFKSWISEMENGRFYPSVPLLSSSRERNLLNKLQEFIQEERNRKYLIITGKVILNCLEDGRAENLLFQYVKGGRTFKDGLRSLQDKTARTSRTVKELADEIIADEISLLSAITQMILDYARFNENKGIECIDPVIDESKLLETFDFIMPYIDEYITSNEAVKYYSSFNKILINLADEIIDLAKNNEDSSDNDESSSPSENPTDSSESSDSEKDEEEGEEKAEKSTSSKESFKDMLEKGLTGTTSPLEDFESSLGSDDSSVLRELKENPERLKLSITKSIASEGEGRRLYEEKVHESKTSLEIASLKKELSKNREYKEENLELLAEYENTSNALQDELNFGNIHSKCNIKFTRYDVTDKNKSDYFDLLKEIRPIAKRMARKSDFFLKEFEPTIVKNLYSGTTFRVQDTANANLRYFSKKKRLEAPFSIEVTLIIDESGSMCGNRIAAAKLTSLIVYEYCKELGISLNIYGHTTTSELFQEDVVITIYKDAKKDDLNDCFRLMQMDAHYNNRDGLPIRLAVKKLEEANVQQKLLIIISDGQPAAHDYYGSAAEADLKDITKYCEKHNIALIAAAIGDDKECIKRIYGNEHFMDISDLDTLPSLIVRRIKSLLR